MSIFKKIFLKEEKQEEKKEVEKKTPLWQMPSTEELNEEERERNPDYDSVVVWFENGYITDVVPDVHYYVNAHLINIDGAVYDVSKIEDVQAIPVPKKGEVEDYMLGTSVFSLDGFLRVKATDADRDGDLDLAIEMLRKENEIMYSMKTFNDIDTYLRLPRYLRRARRFAEAEIEEEKVRKIFKEQADENTKRMLSWAKSEGYVEVHMDGSPICGECAKYRSRLYSVDGNDKNFPDFRVFENYYIKKTCTCRLQLYPYSFDDSGIERDAQFAIENSHRPFEDNRTQEEKDAYEKKVVEIEKDKQDRKDYDWIYENMPEIAPKSYGGYRRMKSKQSANYKKLVNAASEKGYIIK